MNTYLVKCVTKPQPHRALQVFEDFAKGATEDEAVSAKVSALADAGHNVQRVTVVRKV